MGVPLVRRLGPRLPGVALALVDAEFAKHQLWVLLFEQFQHPNGQIPAYEWEFSDLNPPVHAWAVWRVYNMDRIRSGKADRDFLERCFHKLLINFAWWVNKVDREGNNIFEGGVPRARQHHASSTAASARADGARLEQSDATGWMGMFCLNLMRIALELAKENRVYEALATKFFQHYTYVAAAMKHMGNRDYQLWDEQDGFFYDVLRYPDGRFQKFRDPLARRPDPAVRRRAAGRGVDRAVQGVPGEPRLVHQEPAASTSASASTRSSTTARSTHVLTILNQEQLRRLTQRLRDPDEFLSDYGIRSLSKAHQRPPVRARRQRASATSRPSRPCGSRGATRTGAGRSGSRPASC